MSVIYWWEKYTAHHSLSVWFYFCHGQKVNVALMGRECLVIKAYLTNSFLSVDNRSYSYQWCTSWSCSLKVLFRCCGLWAPTAGRLEPCRKSFCFHCCRPSKQMREAVASPRPIPNVPIAFILECTCMPSAHGLSSWVVQFSHITLACMCSLN